MDLIILLKAFILGIVEGATEFLPVSSTGHLIIAGDLLNFNDEKGKVFEIVIQLGAIFAVCWEFRHHLLNTVVDLSSKASAQRFVKNLVFAFLPAAILGFLFLHQIKQFLFNPISVAFALIIGGFAILFIEKNAPKPNTYRVESVSSKQALQIGFAQTLALIPGVSRAGATILGGMLFGLNRAAATEFSFFLAIPILFAASALDLIKNWKLFTTSDIPIFVVGFFTAFVSAVFVIKFLLRYVATHDFRAFAWYRIIFGVMVLIYFWK
jgi:undecaprenyl-diphosphatase